MSEKSPYRILKHEHKFPREPEIYFDLAVKSVSDDFKTTVSKATIRKGSVIFRDGGVLVSSIADVESTHRYAVLVDDGIWLAPRDYEKLDATCFLNHSCDSNVARLGSLVYVAKKDIAAGEELTIDYATLTAGYDGWSLKCLCGHHECRGVITSEDFMKSQLAQRLWEEWPPYIQRRILAGRSA